MSTGEHETKLRIEAQVVSVDPATAQSWRMVERIDSSAVERKCAIFTWPLPFSPASRYTNVFVGLSLGQIQILLHAASATL